ncbi:MAG: PAS domain-containing protein, partial [Erysipelotrichaceae bacterium]
KMSLLCRKFHLEKDNIDISCSAGVCYCPEFGTNHKDLYRNSDMALISAKRNGKSKFEIFTPEMEYVPMVDYKDKTMEIFDEMTDPVFISDAVTSEILYINDSACEIIKKRKDDCLGKRCYEIFWKRCEKCERCQFITNLEYYEEKTLFVDNITPVHIKARVEYFMGKYVKLHYLKVGNNI